MLKPAIDVPAEILSVREKISAVIEGKTKMQFMPGYKQAEFEADGFAHKKRGRLKGQGGATKEQRELAAQRAEEERLAELEEQTKETTAWLMQNADTKNLGMMDSKVLAKLQAAAQTVNGFITRLMESRKGNNGGEQ